MFFIIINLIKLCIDHIRPSADWSISLPLDIWKEMKNVKPSVENFAMLTIELPTRRNWLNAPSFS